MDRCSGSSSKATHEFGTSSKPVVQHPKRIIERSQISSAQESINCPSRLDRIVAISDAPQGRPGTRKPQAAQSLDAQDSSSSVRVSQATIKLAAICSGQPPSARVGPSNDFNRGDAVVNGFEMSVDLFRKSQPSCPRWECVTAVTAHS